MFRALNIAAILAALATGAAAQTSAQAGAIVLRDGQNCYDNKCFRYDARRNTVRIQARLPVPAGNVSGGISPAAFDALFYRALNAGLRGSDR